MTPNPKQLAKNLFILKTISRSGDEDDKKSLYHEWFIAQFGTNQLRKIVPNFSYIYGLFECGQPSYEIGSYCEGTDIGPYLAYENVSPAISLREASKKGLTPSEYANYYCQIVLALIYAAKVKFTHNDLHDANMLLRELPEYYQIRYPDPHGKGNVYIKTKYIATIIDYGYSRIDYNGKPYPAKNRPYVIGEEFYPWTDFYKLACFGLFNNSTKNEATKILKYFTNENLSTIKVNQSNTYYLLPYIETLANRPLADFWDYLLTVMSVSDISINQPWQGVKLFYCEQCHDRSTLWKELAPNTMPSTMLDFLDVMDYYHNDPTMAKTVMDRFPISQVIAVETAKIQKSIQSLKLSVAGLNAKTPVSLRDPATWTGFPELNLYKRFVSPKTTEYDFFAYAELNSYKQYVYTVYKLVDYGLHIYESCLDLNDVVSYFQIADVSTGLIASLRETMKPVYPHFQSILEDQRAISAGTQLFTDSWLYTFINLPKKLDVDRVPEIFA